MKNWKIRYLDFIPILIIAFFLCKLIFTTDISLSGMFDTIYSCVAYFVYGLVIAYFLNPLLSVALRRIIRKNDTETTKRVKRGVAIAVLYLAVVGFISIFVVTIIPAIANGISDFVKELPQYLAKFQIWFNDTIAFFNEDLAKDLSSKLTNIVMNFYDWVTKQVDVEKVSNAVATTVGVSAKVVIRMVFGILISIYFLFGKEKLINHFKRFIYAAFKVERAEKILDYGRQINKIFHDFIISKLVQAFVIFIIGLVVLVPFDIPLAPLISLLLAVTNIIPYIGPWIGAIPSVVLALLYSPVKAFIVLVFIIGMQIVDNLFIAPKIMSDRVGISPLLVIAGVAVGGTFGGFIGMFIGVPVVAVVKLVFYDNFIEKRLKEKGIEI